MDTGQLIALLREVAARVRAALDGLEDWGPAGTRPGQYKSDIVADEAAVDFLIEAGLGVLSEESGRSGPEGELVAVLDPVDGSTNASRNIPWFATSICVVDSDGPLVALVANQATGERYEAVRGEGATRSGHPISPRRERSLENAVLGLAGYPPSYLGWRQFRALGAAALDLCAVADGTLDGFLDCSWSGHAVWDYLGGALVCQEAGAVAGEAFGRELSCLDSATRRFPLAACTPELWEEMAAARATAFPAPSERGEVAL